MTTDLDHLWLPAPEDLELSSDEVHVWRAHLDLMRADVQGLRHTLTPDEVDRAERHRFPKDRERFIISRGLLRAILGQYLHRAPAEIRFSYGPNGKPSLTVEPGGKGSPVQR